MDKRLQEFKLRLTWLLKRRMDWYMMEVVLCVCVLTLLVLLFDGQYFIFFIFFYFPDFFPEKKCLSGERKKERKKERAI